MASKAVQFFDSTLVPSSGKFVWKDDPNSNPKRPILEFVSNNPQDRRAQQKRVAAAISERANASVVGTRSDGKNKFRRKPEEGAVIIIDDLKAVAVEMLVNVDFNDNSSPLNALLTSKKLDLFLLYLTKYFEGFFESLDLERNANPMITEDTPAGKRQRLIRNENAVAVRRLLGKAYSDLLLGNGLPESHHHLLGGRSRVSNTLGDRYVYEVLYKFTCSIVWVAFRRRDFELVEHEIGRVMRSDNFNPSGRPKHYIPEKEVVGVDKNNTKPLSLSEYRRKFLMRPAIMTLLRQTSPAIEAVLPATNPRHLAETVSKKSELREEAVEALADELKAAAESAISPGGPRFLPLRGAILGEPMHNFNLNTLMPLNTMPHDAEPTLLEDISQPTADGILAEGKTIAENCGIATNRPTTGASVVTVDFEATALSAE